MLITRVMRLKPGMMIPSDRPDKLKIERIEPDVLDVIRVANGILPEEYAEPMFAISENG